MKKFLATSCVLLLGFLAPISVHAAQITVEPDAALVRPGDVLNVRVHIEPEGVSVNALEGAIAFPPELLEFQSARDASSIITVWLEHPAETEPGVVTFSGITPGGYAGESGIVLDLAFSARAEGEGSVRVINPRVLRNDGEGSLLSVEARSGVFAVANSAPARDSIQKEAVPPEAFSVEIAQSPGAFEDKRFIVFLTHDKGSGMAGYQVCEGLFAACKDAESPFVLENQKADTLIRVVARDVEGNTRTAVLFTQEAQMRYGVYLLAGIILLGLAFLYRMRRRT